LTELIEAGTRAACSLPLVGAGSQRQIIVMGKKGWAVTRRQRIEESSPLVRDEILTTEDVCALLTGKIKKATLYRHTSQGTGPPFYKIGKHNRWKRGEVMAWFDAHLDEVSRGGR
jgi:predicted DNA-binding transcriptional regulator AlpA